MRSLALAATMLLSTLAVSQQNAAQQKVADSQPVVKRTMLSANPTTTRTYRLQLGGTNYAHDNDTADGSCAVMITTTGYVLTATKVFKNEQQVQFFETIDIDKDGKILKRALLSEPAPEKPPKSGYHYGIVAKKDDVQLFKNFCTWAEHPDSRQMVPADAVSAAKAYIHREELAKK